MGFLESLSESRLHETFAAFVPKGFELGLWRWKGSAMVFGNAATRASGIESWRGWLVGMGRGWWIFQCLKSNEVADAMFWGGGGVGGGWWIWLGFFPVRLKNLRNQRSFALWRQSRCVFLSFMCFRSPITVDFSKFMNPFVNHFVNIQQQAGWVGCVLGCGYLNQDQPKHRLVSKWGALKTCWCGYDDVFSSIWKACLVDV